MVPPCMWMAVGFLGGYGWLLDPSLFSLPHRLLLKLLLCVSKLRILVNGTSTHCLGQNWQFSQTPLPISTPISSKHRESSTLLPKYVSNWFSSFHLCCCCLCSDHLYRLLPSLQSPESRSPSPLCTLLNSFCCSQ